MPRDAAICARMACTGIFPPSEGLVALGLTDPLAQHLQQAERNLGVLGQE